ncbi:hypothetical protein [Neptuniibacter sp. QD37_11]|uniref:hypothetical protein n=1 Tax=Neptuniibacter sp. QD37_11 TaxID=3398209 RepID=UPI0039F48FA9
MEFTTENTAAYSGQSNFTISAYRDGEVVGHIDLVSYDDKLEVHYMESKHKQQGIMNALLGEVANHFPDQAAKGVSFSLATDEGGVALNALMARGRLKPVEQFQGQIEEVNARYNQWQAEFLHTFKPKHPDIVKSMLDSYFANKGEDLPDSHAQFLKDEGIFGSVDYSDLDFNDIYDFHAELEDIESNMALASPRYTVEITDKELKAALREMNRFVECDIVESPAGGVFVDVRGEVKPSDSLRVLPDSKLIYATGSEPGERYILETLDIEQLKTLHSNGSEELDKSGLTVFKKAAELASEIERFSQADNFHWIAHEHYTSQPDLVAMEPEFDLMVGMEQDLAISHLADDYKDVLPYVTPSDQNYDGMSNYEMNLLNHIQCAAEGDYKPSATIALLSDIKEQVSSLKELEGTERSTALATVISSNWDATLGKIQQASKALSVYAANYLSEGDMKVRDTLMKLMSAKEPNQTSLER